jgi:DsbC/DsbD-like thiol-disulfide interchange protein
MKRFLPHRPVSGLLALAAGVLAWTGFQTPAALGQKSDSKVKISAKADKPDDDGKQVVTINLEIENGWHAYANPIGADDFPGVPTTVTVTAKKKPTKVTIKYPKGNLVKDAMSGDHFVYEDRATIKATVQRAKGDTSPLVVTVKIQTCNNKSCLQPATVKLTVK